MRQDASGRTAPPSTVPAAPLPSPQRHGKRRKRRLLRIVLLVAAGLLLLAGGGVGWLCSASGQSWLRETLNATLATALEPYGLRLTLNRLEGLPFRPRLAVRGEDASGCWLELPDVRLSWRAGWQDGLLISLEPLAVHGGGVYRAPRLPDSPEEPALSPGELADSIGHSVSDVLALLGDLPAALPRKTTLFPRAVRSRPASKKKMFFLDR